MSEDEIEQLREYKRRAHIIRRAKERFGVKLSNGDIKHVEFLIQSKSKLARLIGEYVDGDSARYSVNLRDTHLIVMVDRRTGLLQTVLPPPEKRGGVFRMGQIVGVENRKREFRPK